MILPKKVSWGLLTAYFIFDNVVSYIAITRMGGREADLVIAPYVEKYPLLYFVCFLLEIVGVYIGVWLLRMAVADGIKLWKVIDKTVLERIILTSIVIFWPIANSSMNLLFILGHRQPAYMWGIFSLVGFNIAIIYGLFTLLRER